VAGTKHVFTTALAWTGAAAGPTGPAFSRDFVIRTGDGAEIAGSAPVAFKGDGTRASPEDMTVAALSSCHMLTYLALCARKGIAVVAYEDSAEGALDRVGPGKTKFVDAVLRPRVRVAEGKDVEAATALHRDAHEHCFVANSVNFPVRVEPSVTAV
jgi:organic hydroperoxide reductase OsmC/OhrA